MLLIVSLVFRLVSQRRTVRRMLSISSTQNLPVFVVAVREQVDIYRIKIAVRAGVHGVRAPQKGSSTPFRIF